LLDIMSCSSLILVSAMNIISLIIIAAFWAIPGTAWCANEYRYDNQNEVLGRMELYTVKDTESLYEIGRSYKTGYNGITTANPGIDPLVPGKGTRLILPTSWILPDGPHDTGIIINIAEMRLYYFFRKRGLRKVITYPVGIGVEGAETPLGTFRIIEKIKAPAWHVPQSIRKEKPELPEVVPPGPDNPMGSHALRLSLGTVLIHGTDVPWGIGRKVSHGCIRLYPEDITELFNIIPINTKVTIVNQPVKVGVRRGKIYVEVHEDQDHKEYDYLGKTKNILQQKKLLNRVNMKKLAKEVGKMKGYPVDVSMN
jgi:L,D-transpeptidase ErfK/SrfK